MYPRRKKLFFPIKRVFFSAAAEQQQTAKSFSNANGGSVAFPNPGPAADQGSSLIYLFFAAGEEGVNRTVARQSSKGKRDKYRYEVECVTDVPIGCILNR